MQETSPTPTIVGAAPGFIIGVLWLAMAATALWASARGYVNERADWSLGWGIVGVFLLGAAVSALVGTWWHHFRVKRRHH